MRSEDEGPATYELTAPEVLLVRMTCGLYGGDHGAFVPPEAPPEAELLETGARALVRRGLADRKTFRPDRELVRRMLVVAEPDARVVMLAVKPGLAERAVDIYERAGAFVRYQKKSGKQLFGPVEDSRAVAKQLRLQFKPRRSTGDFVHFQLDAAEHYAFAVFCRDRALSPKRRGRIRPANEPPTGPLDTSIDGAVLHPDKKTFALGEIAGLQSLPVPGQAGWERALESLVEKNIIEEKNGGHQLRPFLDDLAQGIFERERFVITRFDYESESPSVRDATVVPVPGSLFRLRSVGRTGLRVDELDRRSFSRLVASVLRPPRKPKT